MDGDWGRRLGALVLALALAGCVGSAGAPARRDVILATTTSTQDSGLLDVLVPRFEQQTGYRVKTIAVGSGQALKLGERGEADVLLSHAPAAEEKLVAAGAVMNRRLVMHNDFVLVGPPGDPAGVRGTPTAREALQRIARAGAPFVSRGDDSGTHKKEQELWAAAGGRPAGAWYLESGTGMAQTLAIAADRGAYTLSDRATYLAHRQRLRLEVVLAGDGPLLNIYHVLEVNPARHPGVNAAGARALADYLVAPQTQAIIAAFGRDRYGEPLFVADAGKKLSDVMSGKP